MLFLERAVLVTVIDLNRERGRRRGEPSTPRCGACERPSVSALCLSCTAVYEALCGDDAPWDCEGPIVVEGRASR